MYACLISLLLAMLGLAFCATYGLTGFALYYTVAACFLVWKLLRLRRLYRLLRASGWPLTPRDLAWADPSDFRGDAVPAFEEIAKLPGFDSEIPVLENLRRLWVQRRARPSPAQLASIAVLYAAVAFAILATITPFMDAAGEIAAAPLFFLYPRGILILAMAAALCYIPIFLGTFALFAFRSLRTDEMARGFGIAGSILMCAILNTL